MNKKIVLLVCMLLLSAALLSGCTEITGKVDGEVDLNKLKFKEGLLTGVVEGNSLKVYLIFDDDYVLEGYAEWDAPYFKDFKDETVIVKYFYDGRNNKILDINIKEDVGVGTNGYSEDVMVNLQLVIDYIDEVFIPEGNDTVDIERIEHDYEFTNDTIYLLDIYDMWCVNNSGYFYFVKNNDDVFYIEDVTKTKSDIFGHVTHHYLIYLDKNILPEP